MKNPDHPLWKLLRLLILMAAMTAILWVNASDFDVTEVKSVVMMLFALAGADGLERVVRK